MALSNTGTISVRIIDNGAGATMETIQVEPGTTLGELFESRYPDSDRKTYAMLVERPDGQNAGGELVGTSWIWDASYVLQHKDKVTISPSKYKAA